MAIRLNRSLLPMVAGLLVLMALACSSDAPAPNPSPTAGQEAVNSTSASNATPTLPPASTPSPESSNDTLAPPVANADEPTPGPYNATETMYRVLPGIGISYPTTAAALDDILRENDISLVPVLIESIRYVFDENVREDVAATLRQLTGQNFQRREWDQWMEWLGKHLDVFQPPEGYVAWKINLLSALDPDYVELLATAEETSRIDMTEVVWGGVAIDGIPDLRNPNTIPADRATYLEPGERVFGVSINGEHRAYPLRITNPHEMVNDVLGGEPISLAW